jgi:arylsulfatase A-like enzyme
MMTVCWKRYLGVFVRFVFGVLCGITHVTQLMSASVKPNFVILLTDDQGFDDLSSHQNPMVETPSLDALAKQSVEFTRFYSAPACAPTRASLLTGRTFIRTGVWHVHYGGDYLLPDEITFADVLRGAGYRTGLFGKWHSGKSAGYWPQDRGFDEVVRGQLYKHFNNSMQPNELPQNLQSRPEYQSQPCPEWANFCLTDRAIQFMETHRHRPFCLYLPFMAPHEPWDAPAELVKKYQAKGCSPRLATLYGLIEQTDTAIGRVLAALKRLELEENTVVIFFSDNGAIDKTTGKVAGDLTKAESAARNVSGLRAKKGTIYDGGIRVPLMVRWPGKFPAVKTDRIAEVSDLFPTLSELAGTTLPKQYLDGRSLVPLLRGEAQTWPDRIICGSALDFVVPARTGQPVVRNNLDFEADRSGVTFERARLYARNQRFKLLKQGQQTALYDMDADSGETTDVSTRYPEETQKFKSEMQRWYEDILKSGRAYQLPTFQIGHLAHPVTLVFFNAAQRLTGDFAGVGQWAHTLTAMQPDSTAKWAIQVRKAGTYRVTLNANVKQRSATIELRAGDHALKVPLNAGISQDLGVLEMKPDDRELQFRIITAAAGSLGTMESLAFELQP